MTETFRCALNQADFLPPADLQTLQLARLKRTVERAYARVPLFRKRMDERGVRPDHIQTLKDLALLPFSCKADLRDEYPFGLFASPMDEVARLHASSGTTGKPIVVGYTKADLDVWGQAVARCLLAAGVRKGDILQNAYGYGLFTGGLGLHGGAETLGITVLPISGGNTERQLMLMKDFKVSAISCTPSYFLHILDTARVKGIDFKETFSLKVGIFGAEPWTEEMRRRIERETGIHASDIYGLSEIVGPGVAGECDRQCGLHIFEDLFYPEIIDPDTGEVLPDGQVGELVFTTLCKDAMPMIRYRTRDLSCIVPQPCACGRTLRRLQRIDARSDDMLIVRGVNLFPTQIETALMRVDGVLPHYQIVLDKKGSLDTVEVRVEVTAERFGDDIRSLELLRKEIAARVFEITGIHVGVSLAEPNTIPRSEGKAKRVFDNRKK